MFHRANSGNPLISLGAIPAWGSWAVVAGGGLAVLRFGSSSGLVLPAMAIRCRLAGTTADFVLIAVSALILVL